MGSVCLFRDVTRAPFFHSYFLFHYFRRNLTSRTVVQYVRAVPEHLACPAHDFNISTIVCIYHPSHCE